MPAKWYYRSLPGAAWSEGRPFGCAFYLGLMSASPASFEGAAVAVVDDPAPPKCGRCGREAVRQPEGWLWCPACGPAGGA